MQKKRSGKKSEKFQKFFQIVTKGEKIKDKKRYLLEI